MSLVSERPLHSTNDTAEGRWVGCNCQGLKKSCTFFGGEVQLARSAVGDVSRNDSRYFLSERLNGNYDNVRFNFSQYNGGGADGDTYTAAT